MYKFDRYARIVLMALVAGIMVYAEIGIARALNRHEAPIQGCKVDPSDPIFCED